MCTHEDHGAMDVKPVILCPAFGGDKVQPNGYDEAQVAPDHQAKTHSSRPESPENRNSTDQSSILDQGQPPIDDSSFSSRSPLCPAPICRQFWKAGGYEDENVIKATLQNGKNSLRIHPRFLHSNATSHKWAFGAIAELLDNAYDEIQNGATFVIVDKTSNPKDGSAALLFQDDGGGMDPEAIRRCMSFGFSDKKSTSAIGQYGNGFKTSSMRLGSDAIVFSRHQNNRTFTQSVGLLSYTFLTKTGHDRIVVPMVDYEFNPSTRASTPLHRNGRDHFLYNLSMLLQWSPYSTEEELLKQFEDIQDHGTRIIIYNLWLSEDGELELDFDTDPHDICIGGEVKKFRTGPYQSTIMAQHFANRLHYSLRVYMSILYIKVPKYFRVLLRGQVVEHHNIAQDDLKWQEVIVYRPQSGGSVEAELLTTIGFLKEAPHVNIHGFNIYHKNRLILPFWKVLRSTGSRCRGVVGVLEANFIQPTHDKQDFEKTSLLQKLETRLRDMENEYWDTHCHYIGYQPPVKKARAQVPPQTFKQRPSAIDDARATPKGTSFQHLTTIPSNSLVGRPVKSICYSQNGSQQGALMKRKEHDHSIERENLKRQGVRHTNLSATSHHSETQVANAPANLMIGEGTHNLIRVNKDLLARCLQYEKTSEQLNLKAQKLRSELAEVQKEITRLSSESRMWDAIKKEK